MKQLEALGESLGCGEAGSELGPLARTASIDAKRIPAWPLRVEAPTPLTW